MSNASTTNRVGYVLSAMSLCQEKVSERQSDREKKGEREGEKCARTGTEWNKTKNQFRVKRKWKLNSPDQRNILVKTIFHTAIIRYLGQS